MKITVKNIMLMAGVSLLAVSCKKDFLDTKIDTNATPKTIITDRATLYTFANAFYASLPNGFTAIDNNLFAAASDEAQQTNPVNEVQVFNQGSLNPNSNPDGGAYKRLYEGIRAANFYLDYSTGWEEFIARNRDTVSDVVNYNRDKRFISWYRGEAHIARAYYYAELIKRYGAVPLVDVTYGQSGGAIPAQKSYNEMVEWIVNEIDTYKDSIAVNWRTNGFADQDGRFTKAFALALKARVLVFAASPLNNEGNAVDKWQRAAAAARDVLTASPELDLALHTNGYGNYFSGNNALNSKETILAVRRPAGNQPEMNNYPISTPGGRSGVTPSHNLVADYEYTGAPDPADPYKNRDPRLAASVVTNGSTWNGRVIDQSPGGADDQAKSNSSKTGYYLKKFLADQLNLTQGGTAQHNWVVFRYAEVLLNYAEAVNEAYGPDDIPAGFPYSARQVLKLLRDRASVLLPIVTAADKTGFRTAVKHERRIELAFEDHRFWDLLRWKDANTALNLAVKGVRITKNPDGSYNYEVRDVAPRVFKDPAMYRYPFSQTEVAAAKGAITQNTGY
jgi:starch-binding outer membrane protein, SusD/RagB family